MLLKSSFEKQVPGTRSGVCVCVCVCVCMCQVGRLRGGQREGSAGRECEKPCSMCEGEEKLRIGKDEGRSIEE